MFTAILNKLFGCNHSNYSFPRTTKAGQKRTEAALTTGTYVVCLDCGTEMPYDLGQMKVVKPNVPAHVIPHESYNAL